MLNIGIHGLPAVGLSHKIQNHARFSTYHHHIICISISNFTYNCKSFTTFYDLHLIFYLKVFWSSGTGKIFVNYSHNAVKQVHVLIHPVCPMWKYIAKCDLRLWREFSIHILFNGNGWIRERYGWHIVSYWNLLKTVNWIYHDVKGGQICNS